MALRAQRGQELVEKHLRRRGRGARLEEGGARARVGERGRAAAGRREGVRVWARERGGAPRRGGRAGEGTRQLAGRRDEALGVLGVAGGLEPLGLHDAAQQKGVVADVPELHVHVEEGGAGPRVRAAQQERPVLLEDRAVARLLVGGDLDVEQRLLHRDEAEVDVALCPAQQVRPQQLRQRAYLLGRLQVAVRGEEAVGVVEAGRVEHVEHRPQLADVVLQRRAGEQQLVRRAERAEGLARARAPVLQPVRLRGVSPLLAACRGRASAPPEGGLVHHDVRPALDGAEDLGARDEHLVRRDAHVEARRAAPAERRALLAGRLVRRPAAARRRHRPLEADERVASRLVAVEEDCVQPGPRRHLALPVRQRRERRDDEEGAVRLAYSQLHPWGAAPPRGGGVWRLAVQL